MTFHDPLDDRAAQEEREESCAEPFWHTLVAQFEAERVAKGLPRAKCLTPTLMSLCDRMDARRAREGGNNA